MDGSASDADAVDDPVEVFLLLCSLRYIAFRSGGATRGQGLPGRGPVRCIDGCLRTATGPGIGRFGGHWEAAEGDRSQYPGSAEIGRKTLMDHDDSSDHNHEVIEDATHESICDQRVALSLCHQQR